MLPFISNTPSLLILYTLAAILKALATILKVPSLYLSNLPSPNATLCQTITYSGFSNHVGQIYSLLFLW